jgi:predicted HAD superfamily Cof-like phosphohydrolase
MEAQTTTDAPTYMEHVLQVEQLFMQHQYWPDGAREAGKYVAAVPADQISEENRGKLISFIAQYSVQKHNATTYDFFEDVEKFNLAAGRTNHRFEPKAIGLHVALQLEELREKLVAICKMSPVLNDDTHQLLTTINAMRHLRHLFKEGVFTQMIADADPIELLDGDIDLCVVSVGSMMSQGANYQRALRKVTDANLAKLVNGIAIKDKDGKIQKPDGWAPADLSDCLHDDFREDLESKSLHG